MEKREALKNLRPKIGTIMDENNISDSERFQNRTLRQILKLQNDLLVEIFKDYLEKRKGVFYKLSNDKQRAYIENCLTKDLKFRNLLIGTIIGHFTVGEYTQFKKQEKELSRRIANLLSQRFYDNLAAPVEEY
jgi:hypothetical protein